MHGTSCSFRSLLFRGCDVELEEQRLRLLDQLRYPRDRGYRLDLLRPRSRLCARAREGKNSRLLFPRTEPAWCKWGIRGAQNWEKSGESNGTSRLGFDRRSTGVGCVDDSRSSSDAFLVRKVTRSSLCNRCAMPSPSNMFSVGSSGRAVGRTALQSLSL